MHVSGNCHKAQWVVSFRCDFKADGNRPWSYYRLDGDDKDWTANPCKNLGESQKEVAKLAERADVLSKHPELEPRLPQLLSVDGPVIAELFSWVPRKIGEGFPLQDKDVSILLNHIVSSRSTSSLKQVVSVVGKHRTAEMIGLTPGQPCWFYTGPPDYEFAGSNQTTDSRPFWKRLLGNYLLAFPDIFIASRKKLRRLDTIQETLYAHRQVTQISVLKYHLDSSSCILQLRMEATLCKYERGALCNCLPIPGEKKAGYSSNAEEPIGVYSPEVVISSPVVEQALSSLSDFWQDRAKAVLISAPPGSGKDSFALSLPHGTGRKASAIQKISLASGTPEDQERLLFGYQQDDGSIEDGLIAKAQHSTIFVDEAHYPEDGPGIRSKLLRTLEAGEYNPIGSMVARKVNDVQWVFASSLPIAGKSRSLGNLHPKDFWTRMTHVMRIEHPLDMGAFRECGLSGFNEICSRQKDVLRDLFKFMWWDRTKAHFNIDSIGLVSELELRNNPREYDPAEILYRGHVATMLRRKPLDMIATEFASVLLAIVGSESLADVSIRGIRSIVSRIYSRTVAFVCAADQSNVFGKLFLGNCVQKRNPSRDERLQLESILGGIRTGIGEIVQEIQQIARLNS